MGSIIPYIILNKQGQSHEVFLLTQPSPKLSLLLAGRRPPGFATPTLWRERWGSSKWRHFWGVRILRVVRFHIRFLFLKILELFGTCKWLGSPPFISAMEFGHLEGVPQPQVLGTYDHHGS